MAESSNNLESNKTDGFIGTKRINGKDIAIKFTCNAMHENWDHLGKFKLTVLESKGSGEDRFISILMKRSGMFKKSCTFSGRDGGNGHTRLESHENNCF